MFWLIADAHAATGSFHPGTSDAIAVYEGDAREGAVGGVQVVRTGAIVLRADDVSSLRAMPEISDIAPLRGRRGVVRILVRPGVDEIELARRLHGSPGIAWAHPDFARRAVPASVPDDPYFAEQWHLENTAQWGSMTTAGVDIRATEAWELSTGMGALIADIDTGVDLTHPDLRVIAGHDYVGDDEDPSPGSEWDDGHGTATSGLAAAIGNNGLGVTGVAYDADVYAIRLLGGATSLSDFYEAFTEAVDAGAWVLSNSWGYSDGCPNVPLYGAEEDALEYAETVGRGGLGSVVVFSAGNGGCDLGDNELLAYPTVIAVSATGGTDDLEWYSSFGEHVDLAAPAGVLTTDVVGDVGYGSWEDDPAYWGPFGGTSAACPVVAGTAALMLSANPRLTAADVRVALCATAERMDLIDADWDADGWSPYYGCGRVDAAAAVWGTADAGAPAAPVLLSPQAEAYEDRVVLEWRTDEPDRLSYEVTWRADGEPTTIETEETSLELTGSVWAGDVVEWTITASDRWGSGDPASGSFTVLAIPDRPKPAEVGGCTTAAYGSIIATLLGAIAAALRRRPETSPYSFCSTHSGRLASAAQRSFRKVDNIVAS
jgi:subtilisin family serine protease